ncbi:MAG: putative DNA-binding domain-containing protein [Burkholderiaceae bacterium]|nr:putative DNA-binding domain-containing protein [Burkholderiaceae bacterium]
MTSQLATSALREFQDGFAQALLAADPVAEVKPDIAALTAQPGFSVYRNTVMKGCVDALQANYPAVERLVGEQWLRAAASIYVRTELPAHPTLLDYGAGFAEFLHAFAPAAELPYLTGVAQLDRWWTEAHTARDESPVEPAAIAQRSLQELEWLVLRPHAAAHWKWFDGLPIFMIWQRNRDTTFDHDAAPEIEWHGQGALITRPHAAVQAIEIDAAACAFLDACAAGETLAEAAAAALQTSAAVDLSSLMATLLNAGAFAADAMTEEVRR